MTMKTASLLVAAGLLVGGLAACQTTTSPAGGTASASCAAPATLPSAISSDLTLQAGCYQPKANVVVTARLSLLPGVTILFPQQLRMDVENGGVLASGGTASDGVVLTGTSDQPGFWGGVNIKTAGAAALAYTEIRDGGDPGTSQGAALWVGAGDSFAMSHTTIDRSGSDGFDTDASASAADLMLAANHYLDNAGYPVSLAANAIGALDPASTYSGNGSPVIDVWGGDVTVDQTWSHLPLPYFVDSGSADISVRAALTIAPASTVEFDSGMSMEVGVGSGNVGTLTAVGQPGNRITFRSGSAGASEYWGHLRFDNNSNRLSYFDLQGAGSSDASEIMVLSSGSLSVDHATIDNTSAGDTLEGICGDSGTTVTVDSATVTFTTDPVVSPTVGCFP